jgi:glycine betaine/proline transport system substrate-binding protein
VEKFSPELIDELGRLTPGNKTISELDYLICRKNKTPQQAVDIFNNH